MAIYNTVHHWLLCFVVQSGQHLCLREACLAWTPINAGVRLIQPDPLLTEPESCA